MRRLSPSQAAWLLVQQPADLNEDEQKALDQLQQAVAEIAAAYTLAQDFVRMVRERTVDGLQTGSHGLPPAASLNSAALPTDSSGIWRR